MPEGHTLRRLALDLTDAFGGDVVAVSSPQGRFADSAALLDGGRLEGARSAGKHLFVEFPADRVVHVHLGLYGSFDVRRLDGSVADVPPPVGQVRLRLLGPRAYADLRGATTCALVTREQAQTVVDGLGADPLDDGADPARTWERVRRSAAPLGTLLMDQSLFAGVGNVYRAEVLFRQRLHPLRPGRTLRAGQFRALWEDLVGLMAAGVRTGRIDTVRAEHTPEATGRPPRVDDHGGEVYVYRRAGQPCLVCGATVRTRELGQRNLFWCPRCQPTFRSRAVG